MIVILQPSRDGASGRTRGFTLVELMIVVIIVGILAAIAIPSFSNASQESRKAALMGQLKTLRSQLSLYKIQHTDTLPNLVTNQWSQFLSTTNVAGTVDTTATGIYGPYVNKLPINELNGNTAVAAAGGAGVGWVYDAATGTLNATNRTSTLTYNEDTGTVQ